MAADIKALDRARDWRLSDFDFDLPEALIAQHPAAHRTDSRLLVVGDPLTDRRFVDFVDLLYPGDLLVFNNSKVIPARLHGVKPTGGKVEILIERILPQQQALAMMRASKAITADTDILIDPARNLHVKVLGRDPYAQDRFLLQFDRPVLPLLHDCGEIPLPPYIAHRPDAQDAERYQTVYAQVPGSVAAPTAGLHFDTTILEALSKKGIRRAEVTLHVGTGTFAPVRTENIDEHQMHTEWCEISAATAELVRDTKAHGGRVIAVGTTSLRTLESGALPSAVRSGSWETNLFIRPGYEFRVVDALLTNFHLPRSTLLMLVSAFIGYDKMRQAYQHAIDRQYRFFSYGDAMFCPAHT